MVTLTLEEQEVHFSMSADDPDTWYCYCDYPKWQRRLEAMGAILVRVSNDGMGRHYTLRADQVSLRKGNQKQNLTDEERAQRSQRMKALRAVQLQAVE